MILVGESWASSSLSKCFIQEDRILGAPALGKSEGLGAATTPFETLVSLDHWRRLGVVCTFGGSGGRDDFIVGDANRLHCF